MADPPVATGTPGSGLGRDKGRNLNIALAVLARESQSSLVLTTWQLLRPGFWSIKGARFEAAFDLVHRFRPNGNPRAFCCPRHCGACSYCNPRAIHRGVSSNTRPNRSAPGIVAPQLIIRVVKNGKKTRSALDSSLLNARRWPQTRFRHPKKIHDSLDTKPHKDLNSP